MKMKILGKKRAVSPVIAVVLLIALTVAAAAIIWAISADLLGTGTVSILATTTSTDSALGTWQGKVTVSSEGTLTKATLENDTSIAATITPTALLKGDNTVKLDFPGTVTGSQKIIFTFVATNSESQTTYTLAVTF